MSAPDAMLRARVREAYDPVPALDAHGELTRLPRRRESRS